MDGGMEKEKNIMIMVNKDMISNKHGNTSFLIL